MTGLASVDTIRARVLGAMRPPVRRRGSEWADEYFYLSPESSADPGRWKCYPFQREPLDAMTDPAIEQVTFMKSARVGYALALDTPIPTPTGWTTMADLQEGDSVFDDLGNACRVRFKSLVYSNHDCYRVTFCDGSSVVADGGHRWMVESDKTLEHLSGERGIGRTGRPKPGQTATFVGLVDTATLARGMAGSRRTLVAVRNAGALNLPPGLLPIPPYTLGLWLGDGHRVSPRITQHRPDVETADYIAEEGVRSEVRYLDARYPNNATVLLDVPAFGRQISKWARSFRGLGLTTRKHIPQAYLRGSADQRLALLRGLMDSDGTITKKGFAEFCNTNFDLARGVYELAVSLGMKASMATRRQRDNVLPQMRVVFRPVPEMNPFRLRRKANRVRPAAKPTITLRRRVVSVDRVESVAVQCIEVDSRSSLFLAGTQMVPTHNTKMLGAAIASYIHQDPCPISIVQPTKDDAKDYSKEEIAPMIRDCAAIRDLVSEAKSRDSDNTILHKSFRGGVLSLIGANSGAGFRRKTRRVMAFDEADAYPVSAGSEGDPIKLGIRRTETFWNRKIIAGSTPLLAVLSRIERMFLAGDQRRYYVPCTQCGEMAILVFNEKTVDKRGDPVGHFMKWPKNRPEDAYFVCRECGGVIEHKDKRAIVEAGEWRAAAPFEGHASFHIWAAYSYSANASWGQIAREFIEANADGPEQLKTFINTVLGETWKDKGEAPPWEILYQRRAMYPIGTCPRGVLFLTVGVDVQKDRLVYEVVGWGRAKRSWSIDSGIIPGDTSDATTDGPWPALNDLLARGFPAENGIELHVAMLAIDSGFNTQHVYDWARTKPMSQVIAVKGGDTAGVVIGTPTPVEVTARGRKLRRGYKVWTVGTNIIKSELYGWLKLGPPTDEARAAGASEPPGYCAFPQYGEEFFKQITAEQLVTDRDPRGFPTFVWELTPGRQNHFLDCRVYARAAAALVGLDRFQESDWLRLERSIASQPTARPVANTEAAPVMQQAKEPEPKKVDPWRQAPQRRSGWIGNRRGWLR